jgi:hypothetical protein
MSGEWIISQADVGDKYRELLDAINRGDHDG